ncbi:hypothetical protein BZA77DRAFT_328752 [Pyronema omphalodes]|nr:hypothetical protein BZA77DRAFT_328752 [Pyronema omphalodes]
MGGGPRVQYPKHVWSPTGGWYSRPANWKANTAVMFAVIFGVAGLAFKMSAEREVRYRMPDPDRFFPSRYWSKQIIEYENARKEEQKNQ